MKENKILKLWKAAARALNNFYSSLCFMLTVNFPDLQYANNS